MTNHNLVFIRTWAGAGTLAYDPYSKMIHASSPEYDPKALNRVSLTITIDESMWRELVKYGEEAGYYKED